MRQSLPAVNNSLYVTNRRLPKPSTNVFSPKTKPVSPKKAVKNTNSPFKKLTDFKIPEAFKTIGEKLKIMKNHNEEFVAEHSEALNSPKVKTQSKISSLFGDAKNKRANTAAKASSSKYVKTAINKKTTHTQEFSQFEIATSYTDHDGPTLFEETIWPQKEDVS